MGDPKLNWKSKNHSSGSQGAPKGENVFKKCPSKCPGGSPGGPQVPFLVILAENVDFLILARRSSESSIIDGLRHPGGPLCFLGEPRALPGGSREGPGDERVFKMALLGSPGGPWEFYKCHFEEAKILTLAHMCPKRVLGCPGGSFWSSRGSF